MEEERREALIAGWAVQLLLGGLNRKSKEQKVEKEQKLGKVKVVMEEEEEVVEMSMGTGLNLQMRLPPLQTRTQTQRIPPGHSQEVDRHQVVPWSPRSQQIPSIWDFVASVFEASYESEPSDSFKMK